MQEDQTPSEQMPWGDRRQRKKKGRTKEEDEQKRVLYSCPCNLERLRQGREGQVSWRSTECGFLERRAELTSVSPCLDIYSVTLAKILKNSIFVPINIGSSKQIVETLINCGTGGMFINQNFAKKFKIENLEKPIKAFNVDGTKNKKGTIKSYMGLEFWIKHKKFKEQFYVTRLGKQKIILGFPWLNKYNLIIDWKKGELKWQPLKINWKGLLGKGQRIRISIERVWFVQGDFFGSVRNWCGHVNSGGLVCLLEL